jgi:hypothetical protein
MARAHPDPKALRRLQDLRRELLAQPPGHNSSEEVVAGTAPPPPRNIPQEPASGAVYTARETPPRGTSLPLLLVNQNLFTHPR